MSDIGPRDVTRAAWQWKWVALGTVALILAVVVGGWQLGWWFAAQDAARQAKVTQNGYSNQTTLREQVTSKLADVTTLTTEITEAASQDQRNALKAQRAAVGNIVCSDAAQVTDGPLPAQQAQWVSKNCSAGSLKPGSPYYQAGTL